MTRFDLVMDGAGRWHGPVTAAAGTLPRSLVAVPAATPGRPWLGVLDGSGGWPRRLLALASAGAAGVLLVEPAPLPDDALAPLRSAALPPVVVQTRWSGSPALRRDGDPLAGLGALRLADCRLVVARGDDRARVLAAQLGLVRAALGRPVAVRHLAATPGAGSGGYSARVELAGGALVTASAVVSDAEDERAEVLAVGADGVLRLVLPGWTSASPAAVSRSSAEDTRVDAPVYESAARASLRALVRAADEGGPGDLEPWLADRSLALAAGLVDGEAEA